MSSWPSRPVSYTHLVDEVSSSGRNTQGVTLIKLAKDETLVGLERVQEPTPVEEDELVEGEEGAEVADSADAPVADAEEGSEE